MGDSGPPLSSMADIDNLTDSTTVVGVAGKLPRAADFSINRFKEVLARSGGLARPYYFTAQIVGGPFGGFIDADLPVRNTPLDIAAQLIPAVVPSSILGRIPFPVPPRSTGTDTEQQVLMCRATQMPDLTVDTTELHFHARRVKVPSSRNYEPLTLTFLHVNDARLRQKFEDWLYDLNHPQLNQSLPIQYGTIVLTQYDMGGRSWVDFLGDLLKGNLRDSHIMSRYIMREVFPTSVSGISYDHEADAQVQTYDVQFQYQWIDHGRG